MPASFASYRTQYRWSDARPNPAGVGAAGETAATVSVGANRVVILNRPGLAPETIMVLADPLNDQLLGPAISATSVLFFVTHGLSGPAEWTLYDFDRTSKRLRRIADNPGGAASPLDGPFPRAVIAAGDGYWVEGAGPDGLASVKQVNLNTGAVATIRTGHPGTVFSYGDHLYWMESPAPDALTEVRQVPGTPPLPTALVSILRGASSFDYSLNMLTWIDPDGRTIKSWNETTGATTTVYKSTDVSRITDVHTVGDWVTWQGVDHPWAFDTSSRIAFPLTSWYGSITAGPANLVITEIIGGASAGKEHSPPTESFDLPANKLPHTNTC